MIFLDDDAAADPHWTQELLAPYLDDDVLGVGGAAVPNWEGPVPAWWPEEFSWVVGCSYRGQPSTTSTVRNLMGCNMSLRRSVLDAVGGFDTGLGRTADRPLGCEETELCIRAAELFPRGRFVLEPRAVVHHAVPRARGAWSYFRARCQAEGVSKAWVAGRVGQNAALSAEQTYVSRVLPTGVLRNLGEAVRGDRSAARRAGAIVAGLAYTAGSYLRTRVSLGNLRTPSVARSEPVLPLVIDLSEPLPAVDARRSESAPYASAVCLVTRAGDPLAKVHLDLAQERLSGEQLGRRLHDALGTLTIDAVTPSAPVRQRATVVVATRDRPQLLQECLRSIFGGTLAPERLIVVDNAPSSSDTADLVRRLAVDEPRLLYVRENRPGLARAHNAALPTSRPRWWPSPTTTWSWIRGGWSGWSERSPTTSTSVVSPA